MSKGIITEEDMEETEVVIPLDYIPCEVSFHLLICRLEPLKKIILICYNKGLSMDSQLHEIPGISENGLTLRIFNEAGFFTFKGLCDFNGQDQLLYDVIAKIKLEVEYRDYTESFWKRTMTQCINIVGRVKNRVEYVLNGPVPDELKCSLSEKVMTDPVIGPSGFTYERNIIVTHIQEHGKDPNTGSTLTEEMLYPNIAISNAIVNHNLSQIRYSI